MCKDMKKKRIEEMFFSYFFLCPLYFMEYVSWADVVGEFTKKNQVINLWFMTCLSIVDKCL